MRNTINSLSFEKAKKLINKINYKSPKPTLKICKFNTYTYIVNPYYKNDYGKKFTPELKSKIRYKYNYKCVSYNISEKELGTKLNIHHKDFNKRNNNIDNLIPLCNKCYAKIHKKNPS